MRCSRLIKVKSKEVAGLTDTPILPIFCIFLPDRGFSARVGGGRKCGKECLELVEAAGVEPVICTENTQVTETENA
jgi:hypothetical protein